MRCLLGSSIESLATLSPENLVAKMEQNSEELHSSQEINSWKNSLYRFVNLLNENGLGNLYLIAEYQIYTAKRIDALICGVNKVTGKKQVTIVEFKQWTHIGENVDQEIVTINVQIGDDFEYRTHPIYQTTTYKRQLLNHHEYIQDGTICIEDIQFLDNYEEAKSSFFEGMYQQYTRQSDTFFIKKETNELVKYLQNTFNLNESGKETAELFLDGDYVIGNVNFAGIKDVFDKKDNAIMLNDQANIAAKINKYVFPSNKESMKNKVVVITGDAGAGKSIIGLHLLYMFYKRTNNKNAMIFTFAKSKMLMETIRSEIGDNTELPYLDNIIGNSRKYKFIVVDEAHRLDNVEKTISTLFRDKKEARIIVFLQDDNQMILPNEEGSVEKFEELSKKNNIPIYMYKLTTQKRSQGQSSYVNRLKKVLFNEQLKTVNSDNTFKINVEDSLNHIDNTLNKLSVDFLVKWFAPFSWEWKSRKGYNNVKAEIVINDNGSIFSKFWNPAANQVSWSRNEDKNDINKVGSVYTAQGLDYDYTGFIWDSSLYYRNGEWFFDLSKSKDFKFVNDAKKILSSHSNETSSKEYQQILRVVKNQFYVLLTRSKKGIFIWFEDDETKHYVTSILNK